MNKNDKEQEICYMLQQVSRQKLQVLLYRPKQSDGLMVLPNQPRSHGNPVRKRRGFCLRHFGIEKLIERSRWTSSVPAFGDHAAKDVHVYRIEYPEGKPIRFREEARYHWVDLESLCDGGQSMRVPWRFIAALAALEKDRLENEPDDEYVQQRRTFIKQADSLTGMKNVPKGTVERLGADAES